MVKGSEIQPKEKIIRMVNVENELFVNRNDLVDLIMAIRKKAGSLNSKHDLKVLVECLLEGELPENE